LAALLTAVGVGSTAVPPAAPRIDALPDDLASGLLDLYQALGGVLARPTLRPGPWDLAFTNGLVVELDEELHFNRYRAMTLDRPWAAALPWSPAYRSQCIDHEAMCLGAGTWGKRWTNSSTESMFGPAGPAGDFAMGAPRWKQRALYDAMKDAYVAANPGFALARVSVHDLVGEVSLGAVLEGVPLTRPDELEALIEGRTHRSVD